MIYSGNIQASLRDKANNSVWDLVGTGTPTNGTSGTGVGLAGPGSSYTNVSNGNRYTNTNTMASPTWSLSTASSFTGDVTINGSGVAAIGANKVLESMLAAASSFGLGAVRYAKSVYDFSVDGGAVSAIKPVSGATLPINAILLGGVLDIVTTFTSGGSATLALGTDAGSAANSILATTAVASLSAGVTTVLIPKFTAGTILKLTAAGTLQWTIATAAMTAGKAGLTIVYVVGN